MRAMRGGKKKAAPPTYFTKRELSLMMGVYSQHVAQGEWKDYALDHLDGLACFTVFRHSYDRPLFTLIKFAARGNQAEGFAMQIGPRLVTKSKSLSTVLDKIDKKLELIKG